MDAEHTVTLDLEEREGGWYLNTNLLELLPKRALALIDTEKLGMAFEPEQRFENSDGTPICLDSDYRGAKRENAVLPGPFAGRESAEGNLALA